MARTRMGQKNAKHRQVERERAHTYLAEAIIRRLDLLAVELDIFLRDGGLRAILLLLAHLAIQDEAVQASLAAQAQARRRAARSAESKSRGLGMNDDGPPDETTG